MKLRNTAIIAGISLASILGCRDGNREVQTEGTQLDTIHGYGGPSAMASADINGDGRVDIVVGTTRGNGNLDLYAFINQGDGKYEKRFVTNLSGHGEGAAVTLADVNGDGFPDLIVGTSKANGNLSVRQFLNDGKGSFQIEK